MKQNTNDIQQNAHCIEARSKNAVTRELTKTVRSRFGFASVLVEAFMRLDAETFRSLVDGSWKGLFPALLRGVLSLLSLVYGTVMHLRNSAYDRRWLRVGTAPIPVISVGNVTLGGTGKTPLVAWIASRARARGLRVAIVSRGFGASHGAPNDEAAELQLLLPDVPHVINSDRVAGATMAAEEFASQLVILDDGLQHRAIARNLNLLVIDATNPDGYGWIFPRGFLRESIRGASRAQVWILSRANSIDSEKRKRIQNHFLMACPTGSCSAWVEAIHAPVSLRSWQGTSESLGVLRREKIAGFAGIGNPQAFRMTLENEGAQLVGFRIFPDHHAFSADDILSLSSWAVACGASRVICTLKDLVKIKAVRLGTIPLFAIEIRLEILVGESLLDAALEPVLQLAAAVESEALFTVPE